LPVVHSNTRRRSFAACAAASVISVCASFASAQEPAPDAPRVSVAPVGCGGLDVSETERLLRTELAIVAARAERVRAPVVHVTCERSRVTIRVRDTRSGRTIEETMPAPPEGQPGRERVMALAASQLFLSSWLGVVLAEERRAEPPPRLRAADPMQPRPARFPARRAKYQAEIAVHLGARLRRLADPVPTAAGRVALGLGSAHMALALHAAGEWTEVSRASGTVRFGLLGGGASFELRHQPAVLGWAASVRATGYWLRAQAEADDPDVRAGSATGSAFEAALGGGPVLALGPSWRASLELSAGALLPGVVARVQDASDVALHGAFAELALAVRHDFGGTP